jgi:tetratricopeptide (TPR) repeat protein
MMKQNWCVVACAAVLPLWLASPAHAQGDPVKCLAPKFPSDERIAGCTAMIEAGMAPKTILARAYESRARAYFEVRDFDHAIADYSQVIQLNPQDRYAYLCRGNANRYKRSFDQAIADYSEAIRLDPNDGLSYVSRAAAYAQTDDFDRAFIDYARAIELNPSDTRAYLSRGSAYRAKGDIDSATADFNHAIQISPTYKYAYFQRGGTYAAKDEFDLAIADYDEGIRLDQKDARAYRGRAMVKFRAGSLAKSLDDLEQSLELNPRDSYTALWREIVARRGNQPSQLADATAQLDMTKWPAPVIRMFLGETTPEATLAAAENSDPRVRKCQVCEANFYAGELALQLGSKDDATRLFGLAVTDCPKTFIEWSGAKAELKALGVNQ